MSLDKPILKICKRTDKAYQDIRNRHYVSNKGTHGQQIHFLIYYKDKIIGIISGASSVYGVKSRDDFFRIPKDTSIKQKYYLPAIINNTVFRLELHEKNLATKILSKWRKTIAVLWEDLYNIPVIGFETFVVETDTRKGYLYKADNWSYVGETQGSTKEHNGLLTKSKRRKTEKKLIYCKWIKNKIIIPTLEYKSSWRFQTPEEKKRARLLNKKRMELIGKTF